MKIKDLLDEEINLNNLKAQLNMISNTNKKLNDMIQKNPALKDELQDYVNNLSSVKNMLSTEIRNAETAKKQSIRRQQANKTVQNKVKLQSAFSKKNI